MSEVPLYSVLSANSPSSAYSDFKHNPRTEKPGFADDFAGRAVGTMHASRAVREGRRAGRDDSEIEGWKGRKETCHT